MRITKITEVEICETCKKEICLFGQITPKNICPICGKHICSNCGSEIYIGKSRNPDFLICHTHTIAESAIVVMKELTNRDPKLQPPKSIMVSKVVFRIEK